MRQLQLPPYIIEWVGAFLLHRRAELRVGQASLWIELLMGVPQGSPLSPLLFLLFINDLLGSLADITPTQAFADDIHLWWWLSHTLQETQAGELALRVVEEWGQRWRMQFNAAKSQMLIISRLKQVQAPILLLNGAPIPRTYTLRCLGV